MTITGWINENLKLLGIQVKKYNKPNYKWLNDLNINTIIDIGANEGQFALKFSQLLPNAKIHSFEPISKCFNALKENTKGVNIEYHNMGVGDEYSEKKINVYKHSPSSSLMEMAELHEDLFPHSIGHQEETIIVDRLDTIFKDKSLKQNILIKIDVQGYESNVIIGGRETLKKAKLVIIEMGYSELYVGQKLFDDLYMMLHELGFRFKGNIAQTLNEKDGSFLYSDSVFINETIK